MWGRLQTVNVLGFLEVAGHRWEVRVLPLLSFLGPLCSTDSDICAWLGKLLESPQKPFDYCVSYLVVVVEVLWIDEVAGREAGITARCHVICLCQHEYSTTY